jgi:hypothetical protein
LSASEPFLETASICEAASRPAHVRHVYRFEHCDDIVTDSARGWDFGVDADPNSFVNAVAEVFGKLVEMLRSIFAPVLVASTAISTFCAYVTGMVTANRIKQAKSARTSEDPA